MKKNIKKILTLVFTAVMVFACIPTIDEPISAAQTKGQLQSKISSINAQQKELEKRLKALSADASKQEEYKKELANKLALSEEKISVLQSKLDLINSQIFESEAQIAEKQAEIEKTKEQFKKRLRTMYMSGNDSTLSIILGSSDFYEMMTSIDMVKRVTEYDKGLVSDMLAQIEVIEQEKAVLDESKVELDASRAEIADEVASLSDSYDKTSQELADLEEQETLAKEQYDKLTASRVEYENEIEKMIAAEKEAAANRVPGSNSTTAPGGVYNPYVQYTQGTGKLDGYVGGDFMWPLHPKPSVYISTYYGIRTYFGYREWHPAIDITGGVNGLPILASNSGYVKTAKWSNSYGYNVMLDHGGGYFTLYAHCSALNVSAGQWVNKGDVIAYVGSTGNSTGPHLHFELWQNYQRTNPLNFVSKP